MSLTKVLEEIKKVRPVAEEDLDAIDMNKPENHPLLATIGARRGRKNQAVEQLKLLRQTYSDLLLKGAFFILTIGSEAKKFEKLASSKEGNCMIAGAEDLFSELAQRVHPDLYSGKGSTSNLFDVVGRHLEDKASELGISEYPQLIMTDRYARNVADKSDFMKLLKEAVTEQVGGELVGINAVRSLTDKAIKRNHKSSVTPILLSTEDEQFVVRLAKDLQRLTPNVFIVQAGETSLNVENAILVPEVSAESMKGALGQIQNNLKK